MKIKGFIKIALMVLIVIMMFSSIAYSDNDNFSMTEIESNALENDTVKTPIKEAIGAVMSVIRIVATGVAIIMITVVAMKYMMAAPGDRADMKKSSVQYVVGAFIVFGAANILTMLVNAFADMAPEVK